MILHFTTELYPPATADRGAESAPAFMSTAVLQHESGELGFGTQEGPRVLAKLVGNAVVIEIANSPQWFASGGETTDSPGLHPRLRSLTLRATHRRTISCTSPDASVLEALKLVTGNQRRIKKNVMLTRYGKPTRSLTPNPFQDWVSESGWATSTKARWLLKHTQGVAIWAFSDWGLYARFLGNTADATQDSILDLGKTLGIPVQMAPTETDLPAW